MQNYSTLITDLASLVKLGQKTTVRYVSTAMNKGLRFSMEFGVLSTEGTKAVPLFEFREQQQRLFYG